MMSSNLTQERQYPTQILSHEDLNNMLDFGVASGESAVSDIALNYGLRKGLSAAVSVEQSSPLGLTVDIGPLEGRDSLGRHVRQATGADNVNCAVDFFGQPTVPATGSRLISVFAFFAWNNIETVTIDGESYVTLREEDCELRVYKGSIADPGFNPAAPSNPGSGAFRLCNILLVPGQTQILNADIRTAFPNQDVLGSSLMTSGGTIIRSPLGNIGHGKLFETVTGQTEFGSIANPVSSEPLLAPFVPEWLAGQAAACAVLNHGLRHGNVMIHKRINLPSNTVAANYVDVSDMVYLYDGSIVDPEIGQYGQLLLWTVHRHDGDEIYHYGQTILLAIGQLPWAQKLLRTQLKWTAFVTMA